MFCVWKQSSSGKILFYKNLSQANCKLCSTTEWTGSVYRSILPGKEAPRVHCQQRRDHTGAQHCIQQGTFLRRNGKMSTIWILQEKKHSTSITIWPSLPWNRIKIAKTTEIHKKFIFPFPASDICCVTELQPCNRVTADFHKTISEMVLWASFQSHIIRKNPLF